MVWRIALNERADLDLENVVAFLAQKNPAAAERLGLKLVETIFSLEHLPNRGVAVRGRPGFRRLLHRPWYLIFYRINEAQQLIEIVRIWECAPGPGDVCVGVTRFGHRLDFVVVARFPGSSVSRRRRRVRRWVERENRV